jgi:hypothetical protein
MQDHAPVIQGKYVVWVLGYDGVEHLQSRMGLTGVKEVLTMGYGILERGRMHAFFPLTERAELIQRCGHDMAWPSLASAVGHSVVTPPQAGVTLR